MKCWKEYSDVWRMFRCEGCFLEGELLLVDGGVGRRTLADVMRMLRWENSDM